MLQAAPRSAYPAYGMCRWLICVSRQVGQKVFLIKIATVFRQGRAAFLRYQAPTCESTTRDNLWL